MPCAIVGGSSSDGFDLDHAFPGGAPAARGGMALMAELRSLTNGLPERDVMQALNLQRED